MRNFSLSFKIQIVGFNLPHHHDIVWPGLASHADNRPIRSQCGKAAIPGRVGRKIKPQPW